VVSYITVHLLTLGSTQPTHTMSSTATTRVALSYKLHSLLKVLKSDLRVSFRQLEGRTPPGRSGHVREDNIKMTVKGTVWDGID
jgi:hypothetical protein